MFKRVLLGAAVLLGQSACLSSYDQNPPSSVQQNTTVSNASPQIRPVQPSDSTALWTQYGDPSVIAANAQNSGSVEAASKLHGCNKFKYHTLGDTMASLGVNMFNTNMNPAPNGTASLLPIELLFAPNSTFSCLNLVAGEMNPTDAADRATKIAQSARYIYCAGALTLGMPPYPARLSESTALTTAGVTKEFDTLAAAAIELVASNLATAANCTDMNGVQAVLFNPDNTCNANGVSCLQGYPPSTEELNLCNKMVTGSAATSAQSVTLASGVVVNVPAVTAITAGKQLAAAAILANALLCE
jgi:hypothetical protein